MSWPGSAATGISLNPPTVHTEADEVDLDEYKHEYYSSERSGIYSL